MRLSYCKTCALLVSLLAASTAPALADPEEGEPPEYIYRDYKPIEAEQTIKNCWDRTYLERTKSTAETLDGISLSIQCLENAIVAAAAEMFDDAFLQDPRNDFRKRLAEIRRPYTAMMRDIAQEHQGCRPCGTDRLSSAPIDYARLLETILRRMDQEQTSKPPRVHHPDYKEWQLRGRPYWPFQ